MEPLLAIKVAAALLSIAALGGMALAGLRLAGAPYPPAALAMAHGVAVAAALTLLIYFAVTVGVPVLVQAALATLLVAGGIGAWLNLGYHARQKAIPFGPMWLHVAFAVAGFSMLLVALIK